MHSLQLYVVARRIVACVETNYWSTDHSYGDQSDRGKWSIRGNISQYITTHVVLRLPIRMSIVMILCRLLPLRRTRG